MKLSIRGIGMKKQVLLQYIVIFLYMICLMACNLKSNTVSENTGKEVVEETNIKNNGGYFVEIDNKVYFWEYNEQMISPIWGDTSPLEYANKDSFIEIEKAKMRYYDKGDKTLYTAFEEYGYGEIYYYNNRFYLTELEIDKKENKNIYKVYSINMDGTDKRQIGEGKIIACNFEDGSIIIENIKEIDEVSYELWTENGSKRKALYSGTEARWNFIGQKEEYLFWEKNIKSEVEGEREKKELWISEFTPEAELKFIMDIPECVKGKVIQEYIAQVEIWKNKVYLLYVAEKSNMETLSVLILTLDMKKLDEMKKIREIHHAKHIPLPKMYLNEEGEVRLTDILKDELYLEKQTLSIATENGNKMEISKNFVPIYMVGSGLGIRIIALENVGDTIYCIYSPVRRLPYVEELTDKRLGTRYIKMEKGGKKTEILIENTLEDIPILAQVWFLEKEEGESRSIVLLEMERVSIYDQERVSKYGLEDTEFVNGYKSFPIHFEKYIAPLSKDLYAHYGYIPNRYKGIMQVKEMNLSEFIDYMKENHWISKEKSLDMYIYYNKPSWKSRGYMPSSEDGFLIEESDKEAFLNRQSILADIYYNLDGEISRIEEVYLEELEEEFLEEEQLELEELLEE